MGEMATNGRGRVSLGARGSGRGSGSRGGAAQSFTATRLPGGAQSDTHQPRFNQTPYSRPAQSPNGGGSSGNGNEAIAEMFAKLLQEVRQGREEYKKMSADVVRISQTIRKLEENFATLQSKLRDQMEASFTIESSSYKV